MWCVFKGHTFRWHSDGRFSVDNLRFFSELHKPRFDDLLETPTSLAGYGISNFKVETFNGDINTLRTDGHFCITSAANSRNLPTQASGNLQVITGGTGNERYCHQVFWRHYSKETYARYQVSGSNDNWSAWERTDGVDWNDVRNRPTQGTASTNQRGDVLLTNDTGLDSENLALSAKGAKKLSQEIAQNRQKTVDLANQKVNKSEINDAVNSDSRTQVASSKAVKTANDNANGRVSKSGDTMTGSLEINNTSSFVRGKKGTTNSWYVGKGSSTSDEINLYNYAYNYGIALKADRVVFGKSAYVGDKAVHHAGLDYVRAESTNYGGVIIDRPSRNDAMFIEANNNRFAFIRRNRTNSQNINVLYTPEANGMLACQAADKAMNLNILRGSHFFKCTGDATGMPAGWDRNSDYNGIQADGDWQRFQILVASNNEMAIRVNDSESDVNAWSPWSMIANENRLTGMIAHFAMSSAPSGWLKANGAAVSRTTHANLFARIGTTFGAGDGRTTFNLPDLRGEFIRGWDDGRNVDRGRGFGSRQDDALQTITGQFTAVQGNPRGIGSYVERIINGAFRHERDTKNHMGDGGRDNWGN